MKSDLEWLSQRLALIERLRFSIKISPIEVGGRLSGFVWAIVKLLDREYRVLLDDEYGDLALRFLPLSFEVLMRSCLDYQDFETSIDWAHANALQDISGEIDAIWRVGCEVGEMVLPIASDVRDQISDLEWQLNSGRAFQLRKKAVSV